MLAWSTNLVPLALSPSEILKALPPFPRFPFRGRISCTHLPRVHGSEGLSIPRRVPARDFPELTRLMPFETSVAKIFSTIMGYHTGSVVGILVHNPDVEDRIEKTVSLFEP